MGMTDDYTRPIAREALPDVSAAIISRSSTIAGLLGFVMVIGIVALALSPTKTGSSDPGVAGKVMGTIMIFAIPVWVFVRMLRQIKRAKRVAELATDESISWHLRGKLLVATDATGVPRVRDALILTRHLRNVLTTVPTAKVVSQPPP